MPSWPVPTVKGCYKNAPSLPNDQFMSMILTGYQICHMKCIVSNFSRLQSFYRIIILKYRQIVCHLTRSFCSHSGITPKHTGVAHGIDHGGVEEDKADLFAVTKHRCRQRFPTGGPYVIGPGEKFLRGIGIKGLLEQTAVFRQ